MFSSFLKDLRVSLRTLAGAPGFVAVALLSLGLGIGANTAIFSVMDALMLRSLPVSNPEELVTFGSGRSAGITAGFPERPAELYSLEFLRRVSAGQKVFSAVGAMSSLSADLHAKFPGQDSQGAEPVQVRLVSGTYFELLGVRAAAGRLLTPEDDVKPGGHPELVMSYAFWQRRFAGDRQIIGRTVNMNGGVYTVIGVAGQGFDGTVVGESPDLYAPLAMQPQLQSWINSPQESLTQYLWIMARRSPGVSIAEAQAQVNVLYKQWLKEVAGPSPTQEQNDAMRRASVALEPAARGFSDLRRQYADPLKILMAMVGIVLLIASANIANLLLARASSRQREVALRTALGATRGRLISQLLTESLVISLLGGVIGLVLAWWSAPLLVNLVSSEPRSMALDVSPKPMVLLFTFGLCVVTGLLFGIGPAWRLTRTHASLALREGKGTVQGGSRQLAGRLLVVAQVTLAMVLTAGAGWFLQTLHKLRNADSGFEQQRVLLVQMDPDSTGLKEKDFARLGKRIEERAMTVPGVAAASYTMLHYSGGRWGMRLWPDGVERVNRNGQVSDANMVGARYFETMGIPLRRGRVFTAADGPKSERVAVINETLARKLFPEGDPLGRLLYNRREEAGYRVIGIVADTRIGSMREEPHGICFLHNGQTEAGFQDLVVRAAGNPAELLPRIRSMIRAENANLAISDITSLGEMVDRSLTQEKMLSKLATVFGGLALVLSAIGIYGVLAYAVTRRTNEIGIRMALGASPGSVLAMVLKESLWIVGAGVLIGIPTTLAAGRLVATQLYGLTPNDPVTIGVACVVLLVTAVAASLIPSSRAARLDPLNALREG